MAHQARAGWRSAAGEGTDIARRGFIGQLGPTSLFGVGFLDLR
jgi:hypothetical protein